MPSACVLSSAKNVLLCQCVNERHELTRGPFCTVLGLEMLLQCSTDCGYSCKTPDPCRQLQQLYSVVDAWWLAVLCMTLHSWAPAQCDSCNKQHCLLSIAEVHAISGLQARERALALWDKKTASLLFRDACNWAAVSVSINPMGP